MNETIQQIINCVDLLTSGKKINDNYLKKLDEQAAREIFLDFMFLLSYPDEHKFQNKDAINTLVNESKMLVSTIFKKD